MYIRHDQNRFLGRRAFTLLEIMIVVTVVGMLAIIAIPNAVKARTAAHVKTCVSNLRQIDSAKQQWALDTKQSETALPTTNDLLPYVKGSRLPLCPAGGTYRFRRVSNSPGCSFWSGGHTLSNLNLDEDALPD